MYHATKRDTLAHVAECAAALLSRAATIIEADGVLNEGGFGLTVDSEPCRCMEVAGAWILADVLGIWNEATAEEVRDLVPQFVSNIALADVVTL